MNSTLQILLFQAHKWENKKVMKTFEIPNSMLDKSVHLKKNTKKNRKKYQIGIHSLTLHCLFHQNKLFYLGRNISITTSASEICQIHFALSGQKLMFLLTPPC